MPATTRRAGSGTSASPTVRPQGPGFVLDEAARKRGLRLRLRYEYLSADVLDDPDSWEPDPDDMLASRRRCDPSSNGCAPTTNGKGGRRRGTVLALRVPPICRDSAARASRVARARDGCIGLRRIASQRDRSSPPCRRRRRAGLAQRVEAPSRAARSICSPDGRVSPTPTPARAIVLDRVGVVAISAIGSCVTPTRGRSRAALGHRPRKRPRSQPSRQQPALLANEMAEPHPAQRARRSVGSGCGVDAHAVARASEPRVESRGDGDDPPCEWVIGDSRPGASEYESVHFRGGAHNGLPRSRRRSGMPGRERRRAPVPRERGVGRGSGSGGRQSERVSRTAYSAEEIRSVAGPDNRMVCFRIRKRMWRPTSTSTRRRPFPPLLVRDGTRGAWPDDRMVSCTRARRVHDHYFFSRRWDLTPVPGIAVGGRDRSRQPAHARRMDPLRSVLLFPSACSRHAIIDLPPTDPRPLTVTGGLGFAGRSGQ